MKGGRGGKATNKRNWEGSSKMTKNQTENEEQKKRRQPRYYLRWRGSEREREGERARLVSAAKEQRRSEEKKGFRSFDEFIIPTGETASGPWKGTIRSKPRSHAPASHLPDSNKRFASFSFSLFRAITPTHQTRRVRFGMGKLSLCFQQRNKPNSNRVGVTRPGRSPRSSCSGLFITRICVYISFQEFGSDDVLAPSLPQFVTSSLSLSPLSLRSPCSEWEWIHSMLLRLLHLHFYCFNWYIYNKANGITK